MQVTADLLHRQIRILIIVHNILSGFLDHLFCGVITLCIYRLVYCCGRLEKPFYKIFLFLGAGDQDKGLIKSDSPWKMVSISRSYICTSWIIQFNTLNI